MKKLVCGILCVVLCAACFGALAQDDDNEPVIVVVQDASELATEPPQEEEADEDDASDEASADEATDEAAAEEEAEEEEPAFTLDTSNYSGEKPAVEWKFPVSLTTLQSAYSVLVNADNLLDSKFKPDPLVKVTGVKRSTSVAVYLQKTAANALVDMFEAAKEVTSYTYTNSKGDAKEAKYENGMTLYLESGYRSYGQQKTMYANRLAKNNGVDDGYVTPPGASEHQSGLCADIVSAAYATGMTQDFKWTPEAQWMKENCGFFGFILRYTEEGEAETKIKFEPWHFRYVGKEAAGYIMVNNMTLEAFTEQWKAAYDEFIAAGGNVEEQLVYEYMRQNAPPESYVMDEYGSDGDAEIALIL